MGSKDRLAHKIVPILLSYKKSNEVFVDMFCGGLGITDKLNGPRIAVDANRYLIALWQQLQCGWVPPDYVSRESWQHIKNKKSEYPDYFVAWAGFCCSYAGRFFEGFAGITETKAGIRNYQDEAKRNVLKQRELLANVQFITGDFECVKIPTNGFIYCDPPYAGTKGYGTNFDTELFFDWAAFMSKKHTVIISEYSAPIGFTEIGSFQVKSSISANGLAGDTRCAQTYTEKLFKII